MSIEQRKVVDAIGTDRATGSVVLTISDHLDWADVPTHLFSLQEKINDYLAFIESRQLYTECPSANGRKLVIQVLFKNQPPEGDARRFLGIAESTIERAGFAFLSKFVPNQSSEPALSSGTSPVGQEPRLP